MAAPTTTRVTLRQKIAKKLYPTKYPVNSTVTAASASASQLVDSILGANGRAQDYVGAWVYTTNAPGSGAGLNTLSKVVTVDFSGTTSTLYLLPAVVGGGTYVAATTYELHYKYSPKILEEKINEILENLRREIWLALTLVTDGDMELTTTTGYSVSGAGTLAKSTSLVFRSRQSLSWTMANAEVLTTSITAANTPAPEASVLVQADVYLPASTNDVTMALRDVTNGADIATARAVKRGWQTLRFIAQVPATCESLSIRFTNNNTNTDAVAISNLVFLPTKDRIFDYPAALEWSEDFAEEVYYFRDGVAITLASASNATRINEQPGQTWGEASIWQNEAAANAYKLELHNTREIEHALFVRGYVDYPVLAADTDTTFAPEDIVVVLAYADLMEEWAQEELDAGRVEVFQSRMAKALDARKKIGPRARHHWKDRGRVHGALR